VGERPTVLMLGGPTAAGKTEAAIAVAEAFGAVIVSADAMQVYRGMDIGTAKVTPEERARAPHVGIDLVDPNQDFDVSDFLALADEAIASGAPVVVAGGTGFYLQALLRGLVRTPPVDPVLRAGLEADPELYRRLQEADPVLAERLHPNDRVRLVRGMEVFLQLGRRLSELQDEHATAPNRVEAVGLHLDRDDLDARIDARVLQMMERGYLEEVRGLLAAGYGPELKPMQSLGYRHLASHLLHGLPLEEAVRLTQRDTRRFARKQRTWMNTLRFEEVREGHVRRALEVAGVAFGRAPAPLHAAGPGPT
jgi:tRNA dimethylallyltransferase